jgi:hypothetical protein
MASGGKLSVGVALLLCACGAPSKEPAATVAMGGAKSVTTFFVTSAGPGRGGDLGGLAGADRHCQALAQAQYAGDHRWRAYLSTSAAPGTAAVNARDRIGKGPWYNAEGTLVARSVEELHGPGSPIGKENALTEIANPVNGVGDTPNTHDILTGSRPDGTAFPAVDDLTCRNWTSADAGKAQVGHHDRQGRGATAASWNSAHATAGCSQAALVSTGGAGLIYCFAID